MRRYYRFIDGLRKFIRAGMEPEEAISLAHTLLRSRIVDREANFLHLVERGIFGYAKSPYLPLLRASRIGLDDLRAWVAHHGLEKTLDQLRAEGIYFTVDEFKGKTPVRRKGISWTCHEAMFDNPFLRFAYEVRSGATRSAGTRIRIDFDYLHQRSLYDAFLLDLHGCLTSPIANWFPVFPGAPGINSSLRFAHIGNRVERWFSQVSENQVRVNWEKRLGTQVILPSIGFWEIRWPSLNMPGFTTPPASRSGRTTLSRRTNTVSSTPSPRPPSAYATPRPIADSACGARSFSSRASR